MRTPAGAGHVQPFALPSSSYDWRLPERSIRVWTPRSYESSPDRRYPTLYCHDGQHLMAEAWKSWRLHVTLSELIDEGTIEEPIVVMIDHVGPLMPGDVGPEMLPLVRRRWLEYNLDVPIFGQRYLSYLCSELKPAIDRAFRTLPSAEHTHALGASMGGTAAFLSVYRRPDVFGHAACLSPAFNAPLIAEVALRGGHRFALASRKPRIYIDNGGDTPDRRVDLLEGLNEGGFWWLDTSLNAGVDGMLSALRGHSETVELAWHREPGGRHSERDWGRRAERPLRHLLGTRSERQSHSHL